MLKITIFTPTYNRGYVIENLYKSLQQQNDFNFEWLVINDGSTDNTDDLFKKWLNEDNKFLIRYYKQDNKGLMYTFNKGVNLANGEYLSKIDSDDYVTDNCVELLINWLETIKNVDGVYGVGGMRGTDIDTPLKGKNYWPKIEKRDGYIDIFDYERDKYNLNADMTEAWSVSILKKFPFPMFDGEKFAPEEIVFNAIALSGYKIRWFPKIICICNYLPDGLTKNHLTIQKQNPLGFSLAWKNKLNLKTTFKRKVFCLIQSGALAIYSGKPRYIWIDNRYKLLSTVLLPFSIIIFIRRWRQFREN